MDRAIKVLPEMCTVYYIECEEAVSNIIANKFKLFWKHYIINMIIYALEEARLRLLESHLNKLSTS